MIFGPGNEEYDLLLDFTKGELIEEIAKLRAKVEWLSQRRYELLHEVAELRQGTA